MANKIQFKRGMSDQIPELAYGEPGFVSDEKELYIGTEKGNIKLTSKSEINQINKQLNNIESISRNLLFLGAEGDGIVDDTESLMNAINLCVLDNGKITSHNSKKYRITKPLIIDGAIDLDLNNSEIIYDGELTDFVVKIINSRNKNHYSNFKINAQDKAKYPLLITNSNTSVFDNFELLNGTEKGLYLKAEGEGFYEMFFNNGRILRNIRNEKVSSNDIGIHCNTSDCHFNDIVVQNYVNCIQNDGLNFFSKIHGWNGMDGNPTGIETTFIISNGETYLDNCYSDTYENVIEIRNESKVRANKLQCQINPLWSSGKRIIKLDENSTGKNAYLDNCDINYGKPLLVDFCNKLSNEINHINCDFKGVKNIPNDTICKKQLFINHNEKNGINLRNGYDDSLSKVGYITIVDSIINGLKVNGNFLTQDNLFDKKGNSSFNINNNILTINTIESWTGVILKTSQLNISNNDVLLFKFKYQTNNNWGVYSQNTVNLSNLYKGVDVLLETGVDYKEYIGIIKFPSSEASFRIESTTGSGSINIKDLVVINLTKDNVLYFNNENDDEYVKRLTDVIKNLDWFEGQKIISPPSQCYVNSSIIEPYKSIKGDNDVSIYQYKNGLRFDKKSNVGTKTILLNSFTIDKTGYLNISKVTEVFNQGSINTSDLDYVGALDIKINGVYQEFISRYDASTHKYKVYKGDNIEIIAVICKNDTDRNISFYLHDINISYCDYRTNEIITTQNVVNEVFTYKNGVVKVFSDEKTLISYTYN